MDVNLSKVHHPFVSRQAACMMLDILFFHKRNTRVTRAVHKLDAAHEAMTNH